MFKIVAMVVVGLIAWSYIRKAMGSLSDTPEAVDPEIPAPKLHEDIARFGTENPKE